MTLARSDALPAPGTTPPPAAVSAPSALAGLRKAAIFVAQLGKEEGGVLLAKLRPREVEGITRELMGLGSVGTDDVDGVMNEFHGLMSAQQFVGRGGVDFARDILSASFGADKADDLLARVNAAYREMPSPHCATPTSAIW
jgi:flagellar motor switch protein FliG